MKSQNGFTHLTVAAHPGPEGRGNAPQKYLWWLLWTAQTPVTDGSSCRRSCRFSLKHPSPHPPPPVIQPYLPSLCDCRVRRPTNGPFLFNSDVSSGRGGSSLIGRRSCASVIEPDPSPALYTVAMATDVNTASSFIEKKKTETFNTLGSFPLKLFS